MNTEKETENNGDGETPSNVDKGKKTKDGNSHGLSLKYQACIFIVIGFLFIFFFYIGGLVDKSMIESLANAKIARGLITFLFAGGTILISLIICIGALLGRGELAKESFYRAREILTILVGVLGTIVGFYFGIATEDQESKLHLAEPILSIQNVIKSQEPVILTSFISGGTNPYRYKISFPDFRDIEIEGIADDTGWIIKEFKAPTVPKEQHIAYHLDVQDANGIKRQFRVEGDKGFRVKP